MKSLTLLQKLLLLCCLSIATTTVLGWSASRSLQSVSDAVDRISQMSLAQRAQMDADMMHDSIRADVLLVELSFAKRDLDMRKAGVGSLREHIARFRDGMKGPARSRQP